MFVCCMQQHCLTPTPNMCCNENISSAQLLMDAAVFKALFIYFHQSACVCVRVYVAL